MDNFNVYKDIQARTKGEIYIGVVLSLIHIFPCMAVRCIFKNQPDYAYVYILYIGLGVILGHNYHFYIHFKGGKGIAATAGIIFSIRCV